MSHSNGFPHVLYRLWLIGMATGHLEVINEILFSYFILLFKLIISSRDVILTDEFGSLGTLRTMFVFGNSTWRYGV